MNNKLIIRKETKEDYKNTELVTMRSFWNLYEPGCREHLVLRKMREDESYSPEISRVAEMNGRIVGGIFYTKAKVVGAAGETQVATFGPLCVEPTLHNLGIGKELLERTIPLVKEMGYPAIIMYGEPEYYQKRGFKRAKEYGISGADGKFYDALQIFVLDEEKMSGITGKFHESKIMSLNDKEETNKFNEEFPYLKPIATKLQPLGNKRLGRICEVQKNIFTIRYFEEEVKAKLKGSFYNEELELPVVGDYVTFLYNQLGESTIVEIVERSSEMKRPNLSGHASGYVKTVLEQCMVANCDYVFIATSLNHDYNLNRIARYCSMILQGKAIPVIILTKADLCDDVISYVEEAKQIAPEVRVHAVSAHTGQGMEELEEYFSEGVTIALMGSSGVGKSTFINTILGKEVMATQEIRANDSKGRHTTTYRTMICLENGVTIIDTPGMRELGLCDVKEGIDETFQDIVELAGECKFHDCSHTTEPGCAIRAAIEDGELSEERYSLYMGLQTESRDYGKMKKIAKMRKEIKKKRR